MGRARSFQKNQTNAVSEIGMMTRSEQDDNLDGSGVDIPQSSSRSLSPTGRRLRPTDSKEGKVATNPRDNEENEHGMLLASCDIEENGFAGTGNPFHFRDTSDSLSLSRSGRRSRGEEDAHSLSSTSSDSSAEMVAHPEDMKYSLCSNLLFLVGASIQTYVAIWDVADATAAAASTDPATENDDKSASIDFMDDIFDHDDLSSRIYYLLNSMGPLLFIVNAIVDIKFATTLRPLPTGDSGRNTTTTINHSNTREGMQGRIYSVLSDLLHGGVMDREEGISETHIMEKMWDLASAITFGVGATLEFSGTLFDDDDEENAAADEGSYFPSYIVNMLSMHIYLISGLIATHKDRELICYPGGSIARRLIACGMMLFLMGSILDCVISYLYNPILAHDHILSDLSLSWCNLLSTLLWNVDAIFYVMADFLLFSLYNTRAFTTCRSCWAWIRERRRRGSDQRGAMELPSGMTVPFIVTGLTKATHHGHNY